jgi:hypothetical protein
VQRLRHPYQIIAELVKLRRPKKFDRGQHPRGCFITKRKRGGATPGFPV